MLNATCASPDDPTAPNVPDRAPLAPPGRRGHTVVAVEQRGVTVDGALNVRDLGGLTTTDGRQVRRGCVLRADALSYLTDAGVATLLDDIGVRLIIDLRRAEEVDYMGRGSLQD